MNTFARISRKYTDGLIGAGVVLFVFSLLGAMFVFGMWMEASAKAMRTEHDAAFVRGCNLEGGRILRSINGELSCLAKGNAP